MQTELELFIAPVAVSRNPSRKFDDKTNRRFGRLTVLNLSTSRRFAWDCRCDCGQERTVLAKHLHLGGTESCGCLCREAVSKAKRVHGKTGTPTHKIWDGMKQKCLNPNARGYESHGARGIRVCPRWLFFKNFFSDMGECPIGHGLKRRNYDSDYTLENCFWSPKEELGIGNLNPLGKVTDISKDLTGHRFGKLIAVEFLGDKQRLWKCQCDCGNIATPTTGNLQAGRSKSCGCVRNKKSSDRTRTHGRSRTRVYRIWALMKKRCANPNDLGYSAYGAKGIIVDPVWANDFEVFYADMGDIPNGMVLGRKDITEHFSKNNCIWTVDRFITPPGMAAKRRQIKQYRNAARSRGYEWELTFEEAIALMESNCHYCGQPPIRKLNTGSNGEFVCNGIDRVNNLVGYITTNSVPCCAICNHAKCDLTKEEFISWVLRAARHIDAHHPPANVP